MNSSRDRDRLLQLLVFNEEFLVNASHQLALITSLPFVHTARRSYRLDESMSRLERDDEASVDPFFEILQICSSRGRRSRNKVSVGEPAEGSLTQNNPKNQRYQPHPGAAAARRAFPGTLVVPPSVTSSRGRLFHAQTQSTDCSASRLRAPTLISTPLNGGSLGSGDDEERSEMRYVM